MSKDRDIDDILESLNQLLREGESHNDDHVESAKTSEKVEQDVDVSQDEPSELDALLPDGVEVAADGFDSDDEIDDDLSDETSEAEAIEPWEQDEPEEDDLEEGEPEADSISDEGDERMSVHRVVLTEEMLVDNPQRSLLSLVGKGSKETEPHANDESAESEAVEPQAEPRLDHALMAELLERVGNDVIHQLQQMLPTLIKSSLEQHLNNLTQNEDDSA